MLGKQKESSPLLLFDIGNVFIHADHRITHKYLLEQHHVPLEKAQNFYKIPEYAHFARGEINGNQFYQAIIHILAAPQLTEAQVRHAHDIHMDHLIKNAMNVLTSVAELYHIAFITTTNAWQNVRERQLHDFYQYSDVIIRSNEQGLTKSDPEIFERTLQILDREKEEILFIDDSSTNIRTARSLSIPSLKVPLNRPNLAVALQSRGIRLK